MNNEEANALIDAYREERAVMKAAGLPTHPNLTEARKSAAVGVACALIDMLSDLPFDVTVDGPSIKISAAPLGFTLAVNDHFLDPGADPVSEAKLATAVSMESLLESYTDVVYGINQLLQEFRLERGMPWT